MEPGAVQPSHSPGRAQIGMVVSARGGFGAAGLPLGHVPFGAAGSVVREGCGSRLDAV